MPPVNLYDSLLERMEGRQYSNYFATWCPFDSHHDPALLIFSDGLAKCLSCGKVWTHQQIDRKIGKHFTPTQRNDSVSKVLPTWRKWEERYGDLDGIVDAAHTFLTKFSQAQKYFKERKIENFIDEGNLGYLDGWCVFPVYDNNHVVIDIVVRSASASSSTRYVVCPVHDNLHPIYVPSWKEVNSASVVYVVYGIIDSISLHLAGLPVVTGVTGKSLSPDLLRPLNKRFIIIPDAGEEEDAHRLANSLGWRCRVKQVNYPEGTKDTDDIRRIYGNESLLQALA